MTKEHLWQGEWIDTPELRARVERLGESLPLVLGRRLETETLLRACDRASRLLQPGTDWHRELTECARQGAAGTESEILETLAGITEFLGRETLELKLTRELGSSEPFSLRRIDFRLPIFEGWAPLGFLVHIAPTNAFGVGVLSVLEGLLAGNVCFLKTGGSDSLFAQRFYERLFALDPTGELRQAVIIARVPSSDTKLLGSVLAHADGVAVWGSEEAVHSIRALSPNTSRIIDWGPKISFAYVARSGAEDPEALRALALDVCRLEQQACSSPQCVYLETENEAELSAFCERLGEALDAVSPTVARTLPDEREWAEINQVTEVARVETCLGSGRVLEGQDRSWRILMEMRSALRASPLYRTVWVKPLPRAKILSTLRPMRAYLQTAAVIASAPDLATLTRTLAQAGVLRVTRPGEMTSSYVGEPHDGVYALPRYANRISFQAGQAALERVERVTRIEELAEPLPGPGPSLSSDPRPAILSKSAFQEATVDPRYSELFFKSGGSSGEPKLSIFTYDDYHLQMSLAAEGLFAAGLDPSRDRCMNLFFGGGLYGGFISFFTILEHLKAVQFPMAAHPDLGQVAETIIKNRVSMLLGMPSYLIQLFASNAEALARARCVKKIYYGGEHFNEAQRRRLHSEFGVELIRSATYGSVDAGPLAYQCLHCEGSIHHLHSRLHDLEIIDLDRDAPVPPGETGRLIFTSKARRGQRIERYDIGDVGRWLEGPCACGRASPRFELQGRHGDVFRAGTMFLSYVRISRILEDWLHFDGELQVVVSQRDGRDRITVRLERRGSLPAEDGVAATLLEHYGDLQEITVTERLLDLEVAFVEGPALERTPGSGKLRRVVDQRLQKESK